MKICYSPAIEFLHKIVIMAQISYPKSVSDKILMHIDEIHDGKNPDEVAFACILEGIEIIKEKGEIENLVKHIEDKYNSSDTRKITYKDSGSMGPIFNSMKIAFDLTTRRQLAREAMLSYAKAKSIIS